MLIFDFVAWTVTLVVHARRVHKLIVIERRDWEGEDGEETKGIRFSIFALLRGLRKRVQALLCKGEKKEMNKVVAAEKDGLRLASILRATLFVMALLPIFTNTVALLLELQGTPRAHNLSALVLLMEDSTFAMSTLAAVTYCTSDVRGAGFTKKQVVVIWAPCCAAAMMAFNIVVLHADRRAKGEGVVMYVGGAAVVWVLSFMTVRSAAKMRASLSRKEIDRHVVYEVAVVIGTVFPPMVVLAAQHASCLIADYYSREASGDSFDYYGNDCSAVNWVTKVSPPCTVCLSCHVCLPVALAFANTGTASQRADLFDRLLQGLLRGNHKEGRGNDVTAEDFVSRDWPVSVLSTFHVQHRGGVGYQ